MSRFPSPRLALSTSLFALALFILFLGFVSTAHAGILAVSNICEQEPIAPGTVIGINSVTASLEAVAKEPTPENIKTARIAACLLEHHLIRVRDELYDGDKITPEEEKAYKFEETLRISLFGIAVAMEKDIKEHGKNPKDYLTEAGTLKALHERLTEALKALGE